MTNSDSDDLELVIGAQPEVFDQIQSEQSVDNEISEQVKEGRLKSFGKSVLNLPGLIYEKLQYTALAFQSDPIHFSKRSVQTAIIAAELLPVNEAIRYGALGYALSNTSGGPLVGAVALGASTFAVEGIAALASSEIITTDSSTKIISSINEKVEKKVPNNFKVNPASEVGLAMFGGSVVVLAEKQREDPTRTTEQNRKHGLFTAGWMAGVFAAEGAFIAENTDTQNILNAKTIGALALTVGLTWAGGKIALRRGKKSLGKPE